MVIILLITWSGIPQNAAHAQKTARLSEEERKRAIEKLERLFDALEEVAKEIPRDTFDPQAIVNKVGKDPIKLFEWVRDNTYLVPYRGSLRGPIGVLMDRLGNSLDRALLLAELLRTVGHEARLSRGALSAKQAEQVLRDARPIPLGGGLPVESESPESVQEMLSKYVQKYGLDQIEMQRVINKMTLQQQQMAEDVAQRVEEQTAAILELIGKPETDIRAAEWAKAVQALQEHWWVQWLYDSRWVDLDTTLPEAKPRKVLTKVQANYQPDKLDEKFLHLVTIRVIIERWNDGKFEEEKVLEHTLRPSELFGKRIVLQHVPVNWPKDLNLLREEKPLERLKTAVLQEKEWLPVLSVGSEQIVQSSFTDLGEVKDDPSKKPESPAEDVGRGAGGVFGGMTGALFDGAPDREDKKESHLTAEWIEYEVRVLEKPTLQIRRKILDLLGPAARHDKKTAAPELSKAVRNQRATVLLGSVEMLFLVCNLSAQYEEHLTATMMLVNRDHLLRLVKARFVREPTEALGELALLIPLPGPAYILARVRSKFRQKRFPLYLDTVNIFSYHTRLRYDDDKGPEYARAIDIVRNELAVPFVSQRDRFGERVRQGVLETNAEAAIMSKYGLVANTALLFAQTRREGDEWLRLHEAEGRAWQKLWLPEDIRTRIKQDLADGYLVLAPRKSVLVNGRALIGWWRVDPRTGNTLGVGEHGWGQAMSEYAEEAFVLQEIRSTIEGFANMMRCLTLGITSPLRGMNPQYDPLVQKCVWDQICGKLMGLLNPFGRMDRTWTNLIRQLTFDWLSSGFCEDIWEAGRRVKH